MYSLCDDVTLDPCCQYAPRLENQISFVLKLQDLAETELFGWQFPRHADRHNCKTNELGNSLD